MYLGRSFKARLVAKIGVVFEKRKLPARSANFGSQILLADELDESLDRIDVGGDELARLDHRAVFEHDRGRLALLDENPLDAVGLDIIDADCATSCARDCRRARATCRGRAAG